MNKKFDRDRFKWFLERNIKRLKNLSFLKAAKIQKEILKFFDFKKGIKDDPVSFKLLIRNEFNKGI